MEAVTAEGTDEGLCLSAPSALCLSASMAETASRGTETEGVLDDVMTLCTLRTILESMGMFESAKACLRQVLRRAPVPDKSYARQSYVRCNKEDHEDTEPYTWTSTRFARAS